MQGEMTYHLRWDVWERKGRKQMTVADRYEGEVVGRCGCGSCLVWQRDESGEWHVEHADAERALTCSAVTANAEPEYEEAA
jgi:hypothetical protein